MSQPTPRGLPDPVVPPDEYDDEYYRSACAGYEEWVSSGGQTVAGIYPGMLARADLSPGEVVVDIGTGRGELVAVAAASGAARAIGVDYSASAIALARQTLAAHGVEHVAEVHLADARGVPVADATADLVTLIDVVEHLAPDELRSTLAEAFRILRPGGRVIAHTMPSRTLYDVTYRVHRGLVRVLGARWPRDPRNDYERAMHVNEQTVRSLRRAFREVGFRPVRVELGEMVYTDFLPDQRHARLYHRLARHRPTRRLAAADLFATGWRP